MLVLEFVVGGKVVHTERCAGMEVSEEGCQFAQSLFRGVTDDPWLMRAILVDAENPENDTTLVLGTETEGMVSPHLLAMSGEINAEEWTASLEDDLNSN